MSRTTFATDTTHVAGGGSGGLGANSNQHLQELQVQALQQQLRQQHQQQLLQHHQQQQQQQQQQLQQQPARNWT
jgi:hypothetical protein